MPNIFGANGGGSSNIFSSAGGGTALSLLSAARSFYKGIGLSQNARALNDDYLNQSISGLNSILQNSISGSSTIEGAQMQINALRSKTPLNHLSQDLQDQAAEAAAKNADNGNAAASTTNGTNVDTKA